MPKYFHLEDGVWTYNWLNTKDLGEDEVGEYEQEYRIQPIVRSTLDTAGVFVSPSTGQSVASASGTGSAGGGTEQSDMSSSSEGATCDDDDVTEDGSCSTTMSVGVPAEEAAVAAAAAAAGAAVTTDDKGTGHRSRKGHSSHKGRRSNDALRKLAKELTAVVEQHNREIETLKQQTVALGNTAARLAQSTRTSTESTTGLKTPLVLILVVLLMLLYRMWRLTAAIQARNN